MSGGSFNYLCYKLDDAEIFEYSALEDLRDMETYLRELGKPTAADEIGAFIKIVEDARQAVSTSGSRLYNLVHNTEWERSGDYGADAIDHAMSELM